MRRATICARTADGSSGGSSGCARIAYRSQRRLECFPRTRSSWPCRSGQGEIALMYRSTDRSPRGAVVMLRLFPARLSNGSGPRGLDGSLFPALASPRCASFARHGRIPDLHHLVEFYLHPLRGLAFADDRQVACLVATSWKPPREFGDRRDELKRTIRHRTIPTSTERHQVQRAQGFYALSGVIG